MNKTKISIFCQSSFLLEYINGYYTKDMYIHLCLMLHNFANQNNFGFVDKIKLWSVVLPSFVKLARITELQRNDKISHYDSFCVKQHNLYGRSINSSHATTLTYYYLVPNLLTNIEISKTFLEYPFKYTMALSLYNFSCLSFLGHVMYFQTIYICCHSFNQITFIILW